MKRRSTRAILNILASFACLFLFSGCGPNRAEWMAQTASAQAQAATADIGNPEEVKAQARDGATVLRQLDAALFVPVITDPQATDAHRQKALAYSRETSLTYTALDTIASSQTDEAYTQAVMGMCTPDMRDAAAGVGAILTTIAAVARSNPGKSPAQLGEYYKTFGDRMLAVPSRCQQADQALALASQQEQQAEAKYQVNLATATSVATAVLMSGAIYEGALAESRANAVEQNQATFQQWQTQIQLQNIDSDLRRQNYLLQQQAQPATIPMPKPAPPIQSPVD